MGKSNISFTGKPYRPSCGTEGMDFAEIFCDRCIKDQDEDDPCTIYTNTMVFMQNEPEYPKEWIYDEQEQPTCTAFEEK
jgi:hypothetical protein